MKNGSFSSLADLALLARSQVSDSVKGELVAEAQRKLVESLKDVGALSAQEAGELLA